jgi:hypothetical protein
VRETEPRLPFNRLWFLLPGMDPCSDADTCADAIEKLLAASVVPHQCIFLGANKQAGRLPVDEVVWLVVTGWWRD